MTRTKTLLWLLLPTLLLTMDCMTARAGEWPTVVRPTIKSASVFMITDYGASTTSADNTTALQKALDACAEAGGGKVVIPKGRFLCGPVVMSSNTNLFLSKGATLQVLPYGTYPKKEGSTKDYPDFITCKSGSHDLIISGEGSIDGQGADWWSAYDNASAKFRRGALIRFNKASQILIEGITMNNAPGSHITIGSNGNSSNATIKHVTIDTRVPSHNTDGIDVWATHVDIDSCYISDGDDNVAIDRGSQYVRITHCQFGYGHGTSVGSFTREVKHVLIDNCSYQKTDNGIRLKSNNDRGGGEEDFVFTNLVMTGVKYTLYIDCYYNKKFTTPALDEASKVEVLPTTPSFKDILLKNVTSTAASGFNAVFVYGRPECHVKNITFDNVRIAATKGMIINFADNVRFINGSKVKVRDGDVMLSKYESDVKY
jgi:polygalacturonase